MHGRASPLVMVLLASPAAGAGEPLWTPLGPDAAHVAMLEMDTESVAEHNGLRMAWLRVSLGSPESGARQAYQSVITLLAFDCKGERYAITRITTYSGLLGDGEVIDRRDRSPSDWQWTVPAAGSAEARMLGLACGPPAADR